MVAIDRAASVVWLRPTMMVRLANGNCTLSRRCQEVCPSELVTSIIAGLTVRMPWAEIRISGGTA